MGAYTLKQWLALREITAAQLAEQTGLTAVTISNISTGKQKPTYNTLKIICNVLNIKFDELKL